MSLLTSSQPRVTGEKELDPKMKGPSGVQVLQKPGAKILNVSGVHLLNKLPKPNTSVLTGVKLVNTQQGGI